MQGTAIGIFYLLEGSGNIVYGLFLKAYGLSTNAESVLTLYRDDGLPVFWISGIALNSFGLLLLIIVHRKYNLGLDVP